MGEQVVKVGLIGVGRMGKNHLRNLALLKDVDVSFIYDLNVREAENLAKQYSVRVSRDLPEDLKKVDGVVIAAPTSTHYEYGLLASQYVKNIFIEKPLTHNLETTRKLAKVFQENRIKCQVGFIERYNSAVSALEKLILKSEKVINIDFVRTNKVSSRIKDVGVIMDLMIHDLDLAIMLNGAPENIYAQGYVNDGLIEFGRAIITHQNGAFSNVVASRITEKRYRQISATCNDMYIDCNLLSKELFVNKQSVEQYIDDVSISSRQETIDVRLEESLLLELLDFIKLCKGEDVCGPDIQAGVMAMDVASKVKSIILGENQ